MYRPESLARSQKKKIRAVVVGTSVTILTFLNRQILASVFSSKRLKQRRTKNNYPERERDRQTDRQTKRQAATETERQIDRQADRQTDKQRDAGALSYYMTAYILDTTYMYAIVSE